MENSSGIIAGHLLWRGAYFGSVLLLNLVIARTFSALHSGEIFFIVSNLSLVLLLLGFSLESGAVYLISRGQANARRVAGILLAWTCAALFLTALLAPLALPYVPARFTDPELYPAILLFVGGVLLTTFFSAMFYAAHDFRLPNRILAAVNFALAAITLWLQANSGFRHHFLLIYFSAFFVQGLCLVLAYARVKKPVTAEITGKFLRPLFRYSAVALAANGIYFLVNRIDYWFVERYCPGESLGNYIQASKIAQMLVVVPSITASTLFPLIASGKIKPDDPAVLRTARVLGSGLFFCSLPILFFGRWLFPFFYGRSFNTLYGLLILLMPGVCFVAANYPLAALNSARANIALNIRGSLLALVVIVAGDLWLVPGGGARAAAVVSSFGQFVYFAYVLFYYLRENPGRRWRDAVGLRRSDLSWFFRFLKRTRGLKKVRPVTAQNGEKKIIWLASWYPSRADPFTGDFIQRQARATATVQPLSVLFVTREPPVLSPGADAAAPIEPAPTALADPAHPRNFRGLTETILFYGGTGSLRIFPAAVRYLFLQWKWLRTYHRNHGLPDLLHVHVTLRAGLAAWVMKKRFGIPYIVTEHATTFYDNSAVPLVKKTAAYQSLMRLVIGNADLVIPVSVALGRQLERRYGRLPLQPVANVVDTTLFYPAASRSAVFRFLHVSSMGAVKNVPAILRVFGLLRDAQRGSGRIAELVLAGPADDALRALAAGQDDVHFTGELSYPGVAGEMRKASAFVLFSDIENQPCVLLESLCSGVPVIAANTGGVAEVVDSANGLLVEPGNEQQLLAAMRRMMAEREMFDSAAIARNAAALYAYSVIANEYAAIYEKILSRGK